MPFGAHVNRTQALQDIHQSISPTPQPGPYILRQVTQRTQYTRNLSANSNWLLNTETLRWPSSSWAWA